jgi:hypothetical protein
VVPVLPGHILAAERWRPGGQGGDHDHGMEVIGISLVDSAVDVTAPLFSQGPLERAPGGIAPERARGERTRGGPG